MRFSLRFALAAGFLTVAAGAEAQMRYESMDANSDGVITRDEWRGSDRAFRSEDWNGDGVLSGDEVRRGARRRSWTQDLNRDGRVDALDDQIARRFDGYDANRDGRVTAREWPGDRKLFLRLDGNHDGELTLQEYTGGNGYTLDAQGGPAMLFEDLDKNRDGWVIRREWPFGNAAFDRVDANGDNRLNRSEYESAGSDSKTDSRQSDAFRMGYERGRDEGRAAGREDYVRNQRWDLEGQRELEQADSGYAPQMGALSDYQAGYRDGFREAYREGYESARTE